MRAFKLNKITYKLVIRKGLKTLLFIYTFISFHSGVTKDNKTLCHHYLTDNNNKKIDVSTFLDYIKHFYSNEDPEHTSKYIHGYLEE
jgi:hypothetical protein